jgi:hypothetical protein
MTSRGRPRCQTRYAAASSPTTMDVKTLIRTPKKVSAGSVRSSSIHSRPTQ